MNVLMLVWTDVAGDARVCREARTLAGSGYRVHVIGRDVPPDFQPPPGVTVSSAAGGSGLRRDSRARRAGGNVPDARPSALKRLLRWLLLPEHVRVSLRAWTEAARADTLKRDFDVVHAHDFTTLELAAELAADRGVPFVYDSHEYWYGRPRTGRPTPLRRRRERSLERRLGHRAAAALTVGDGIAELLKAEQGWPHVHTVRNTFPIATPSGPGELGQAPTGLVYAGRIAPDRELETIVAAAPEIGLPVTLLGPADPTYRVSFDPGPVTVRPPVSVEEAGEELRRAGLALVTHSDRWINHRLALPNKLFQAVSVGVPVVASDVDELAQVVRAHDLGTLFRVGDPQSLVAAVAEARQRYAQLRENVRKAASALSWERDAEVLLDVYAGIASEAGVGERRIR